MLALPERIQQKGLEQALERLQQKGIDESLKAIEIKVAIASHRLLINTDRDVLVKLRRDLKNTNARLRYAQSQHNYLTTQIEIGQRAKGLKEMVTTFPLWVDPWREKQLFEEKIEEIKKLQEAPKWSPRNLTKELITVGKQTNILLEEIEGLQRERFKEKETPRPFVESLAARNPLQKITELRGKVPLWGRVVLGSTAVAALVVGLNFLGKPLNTTNPETPQKAAITRQYVPLVQPLPRISITEAVPVQQIAQQVSPEPKKAFKDNLVENNLHKRAKQKDTQPESLRPKSQPTPPIIQPEQEKVYISDSVIEQTPEKYRELIIKAAQKYGVSARLVSSIINTESQWNPRAFSKKGAKGLGQFMDPTAKELGINPWDEEQAIEGVAKYLKWISEQLGTNDERDMAGAYNCGVQAILDHNGLPPYPETREFVRKVTSGTTNN